MGLFQRMWEMFGAIVARALAMLYDRRARAFERGGVAARRRELVGIVRTGGSVLEVGAGTGATLAAGAYAGGPGRFSRIVTTEPDDGMRAVLQKRALEDVDAAAKVEVLDARFPNLPFPDQEFDAVLCFMVISHVHQRAEAVKEACRVLKIGGKLLLMDHGASKHGHGHGHGGHSHGGGGHGEGQIHEHGHAHSGHAHGAHAHDATEKRAHQNGGHEGKGHDPQARQSGLFFWFREWFQFVFVRRTDAKLEVLLEDFKKEDRLKEDFVSRMMTQGFFMEICYGSFTRVS